MRIPIGMTYVAHGIFALVALAGGVVFAMMKLGSMDFGSAQAMGTLVGMFAAIPAGIALLIAAYSAIAVIVALLGRRSAPRDMLLLPAGFLVSIIVASVLADFETMAWTVVAYLMVAGYVTMTIVLIVGHLSRRRGPEGVPAD